MKNILILVDCSASVNIFHKTLYSKIISNICKNNDSNYIDIYGFGNDLFRLSVDEYMKLEFHGGTSISELYDTIKNNYDECHLLTDGCFEMFPGKFDKNYMYIIDDHPIFNQQKYNWEIYLLAFIYSNEQIQILKNIWNGVKNEMAN